MGVLFQEYRHSILRVSCLGMNGGVLIHHRRTMRKPDWCANWFEVRERCARVSLTR